MIDIVSESHSIERHAGLRTNNDGRFFHAQLTVPYHNI